MRYVHTVVAWYSVVYAGLGRLLSWWFGSVVGGAQVWLVGSGSHVPGCEGTLNAHSAFTLMSD